MTFLNIKQEFYTESEHLAAVIQLATEQFPVGCTVRVKDTPYIGRVVGYNKKLGGFWPGVRYPIQVQLESACVPSLAVALDAVFEYGLDRVISL